MRSALLLVLLSCVAACSSDQDDFSFLEANAENHSDAMLAAEQALRRGCPDLADHHEVFQLLPAVTERASITGQREFEWKQSTTFNLQVDRPYAPEAAREHYCSYEVGLTPQAGVIASKKGCVLLCDAHVPSTQHFVKRL